MFKVTLVFLMLGALVATAHGADQCSCPDIQNSLSHLNSGFEDLKKVVDCMREDLHMQQFNWSIDTNGIKSEMASIRQLLVNLQQTTVRNENQMIEEIRQIRLKQVNETQALREMKSEIDEIRQILIQHQNWSEIAQVLQRKTACPLGFDYLPEAGRCFTFISEKITWDAATAKCRGIMPGVHMAAITSQEEHDAIVRYLQLQFSKNGLASPPYAHEDRLLNGVWISGQRSNPERCDNPFVWKTLNGIKIPFNFTRWMAGEPNCGKEANNEFCVQIMPGEGYGWNDCPCGLSYFPLCEM